MAVDVIGLKLVREGRVPYDRRQAILHPVDAAAVVAPLLRDAPREVFAVVLLDTRHRVLGVHRAAEGGIDACSVTPREIFTAALLANAAAVILAHNHPSGDPAPSADDIRITAKLCEAGRLLGVRVLDHLIVGESSVRAMRKDEPGLGWA
jgi:DNA repair protein RadC